MVRPMPGPSPWHRAFTTGPTAPATLQKRQQPADGRTAWVRDGKLPRGRWRPRPVIVRRHCVSHMVPSPKFIAKAKPWPKASSARARWIASPSHAHQGTRHQPTHPPARTPPCPAPQRPAPLDPPPPSTLALARMAAEAQAESPGPVPPPPPARGSSSASPEKRALLVPGADDIGGGGEEEEEERRRLPDPKRRRACVAALDSVPTAAAAEAEGAGVPGSGGDADGGASFSFQHARGGFVALETTPKFGSFNPPGEDAELANLDLKPAEGGAGGEGSREADGGAPSASARGAEGNDDSAQVVGGGEVDGQNQT
ncbi:uncharacterized protein LOC101762472 [Setaria italica]|nr:uncharacterized protein LOC101762472 [Setaria italica]